MVLSLLQVLTWNEAHVGFGEIKTKISIQRHVPMHTPLLKFGVLTECTLEVLPGGDIALKGLLLK